MSQFELLGSSLVFDLARGDPHYGDDVGDDVGGALVALGSWVLGRLAKGEQTSDGAHEERDRER